MWFRLVAEAGTVLVAVKSRQSAAHCQRIPTLVASFVGTSVDRYVVLLFLRWVPFCDLDSGFDSGWQVEVPCAELRVECQKIGEYLLALPAVTTV